MPETIYCVKCKQKVQAQGHVAQYDTKRGKRTMFKGQCPQCGSKISKFMKETK